MESENHAHCIICGHYKKLPDYYYEDYYICDRCVKTFPDDYLLYRINCRKNGIYRRSFDLLEERLVFGDRNLNFDFNKITNEEILMTEDVEDFKEEE